MIAAALILAPLCAGLLAFWWRSDGPRRALLVLTALAHAGLTIAAWVEWNDHRSSSTPIAILPGCPHSS